MRLHPAAIPVLSLLALSASAAQQPGREAPARRPSAPARGGTAPARPAPPPADLAKGLQTPEVRAGGYRIVVERIFQAQNITAEYAGDVASDGPAGGVSGRQLLYVTLAVFPPPGASLDQISGLESKILALSAPGKPVPFRAAGADDAEPGRGDAWRTLLVAQDVSLAVSRLNGLSGELIVYPKSKRVRLEFPLKEKLPQTRQVDGVSATLREIQERARVLQVALSTEASVALDLSRAPGSSPYGIDAVSKAGLVFPPSGGSIQPDGGDKVETRQYLLTFMDLLERPEKIRVDLLVRSGTPQRIPFRLPDLPLPDTLPLADAPGSSADAGLLSPRDPLYAAAGGSLTVPAPAGGGTGMLLIGLSRQEEGGFGPWRWLETTPDGSKHVVIQPLRPGRYRVRRAWSTGRLPGSSTAAAVEVEVLAGKSVTAPEARP